jgi:F0F1-type ATP synthase epsilon subunit
MAEDLSPTPGKLRVKITCPISSVIDVEADFVQIPALQGERVILPNRTPLFCVLNQGKVIIHREGHAPMVYLISKGVCEVRRDICAVMAWGMRPDEINPKKLQRLWDEASQVLPSIRSRYAEREIQNRISYYKMLLASVEKS